MSAYHHDESTTEDYLNRSDFSEHLSNVIVNKPGKPCFTASIEGPWGYGKTSVLKMMLDFVKKDEEKRDNTIIVEFNPWLIGSAEFLIPEFLSLLSTKLYLKDLEDLSSEILEYASFFTQLMQLAPSADVSLASKAGGVLLQRLSNKLKERPRLNVDFLDKKQKVSRLLSDIGMNVLVVIDDIDRLTPKEAFEVIRLVKSVADFDGVSFVLAYDPKYLNDVLNAHHISNSAEYLDKVIQLRVALPVISRTNMEKMAQSELKALSSLLPIQTEESNALESFSYFHYKYFHQLIKNPRELKRFFNHLRFVYEQVGTEVCFTDLYALSLIAIKYPSLYDDIKTYPEKYVGTYLEDQTSRGLISLFSDGEDNNEINEHVEKVVGKDDPKIKIITHLIRSLFKRNQSSDARKRVSASQRLFIALHFQTPLGFVSEIEVLDFITGKIPVNDFLHEVAEREAEKRFFELMAFNLGDNPEYAESVLVDTAKYYIPDLSAGSYMYGSGMFDFDLLTQIQYLFVELIKTSQDRVDLFKRLLSDDSLILLTGYLITLLIGEKGTIDSVLNEAHIDELAADFFEKGIETLRDKKIKSHPLESKMHWYLRGINVERTTNFLCETLADEGLLRVAQLICSSGKDQNGAFFQLDPDIFGENFDLDGFKSMADEKLASSSDGELSILEKAVLQACVDGQRYYLSDGVATEPF